MRTGKNTAISDGGIIVSLSVELNEDMISIKDQDGNPDNLSVGYGKGHDIVIGKMNGKEIYSDADKFDGHSFYRSTILLPSER